MKFDLPGRARFALFLALVVSLAVSAWPSATQKSVAQGVTVSVTAGNVGEDAGVWDFAVSFHSNGPPLDDNLMDNAVLIADGKRIKPLWWEGEAATLSYHHRAGVLKFVAFKPRPKHLELHLQRKGEAKPRVFMWEFGDWIATK
jgi:hypothetical protein